MTARTPDEVFGTHRPLERPWPRPRPAGARPGQPPVPRTPRVVEHLRKALEWQALLESGEIPNQAAIARQVGITRARVTQVLGLLRLDSMIQQRILAMPDTVRRPVVTERALRPIAHLEDLTNQKAKFEELLGQSV